MHVVIFAFQNNKLNKKKKQKKDLQLNERKYFSFKNKFNKTTKTIAIF